MELIKIQSKLKAPKEQFNGFGKYKYRSCEDILEALKPILFEFNCYVIVSDDIVNINAPFELREINEKGASRNIKADCKTYVKATARLFNSENKLIAETTSFAREEETKKGMDLSQLTGSTSSYARKYALNGLFAIDDTKDSDYLNTHGKSEISEPKVLDFEEFKQALLDCSSFNELKSLWADNALRFKDNTKQYSELENVKNSKKEELNELEDPKLAKALANKFNNDNKGK